MFWNEWLIINFQLVSTAGFFARKFEYNSKGYNLVEGIHGIHETKSYVTICYGNQTLHW